MVFIVTFSCMWICTLIVFTHRHKHTRMHTPLSFHILSCWYRSLFLILILSWPAPHQLLSVGENMSEWHQRSREVWYSSRCNNSALDTDCRQARQSTLLWGKTSQEHFYPSNYYANNFRLVSSSCYGEKMNLQMNIKDSIGGRFELGL